MRPPYPGAHGQWYLLIFQTSLIIASGMMDEGFGELGTSLMCDTGVAKDVVGLSNVHAI
jgi:hypothetical protein